MIIDITHIIVNDINFTWYMLLIKTKSYYFDKAKVLKLPLLSFNCLLKFKIWIRCDNSVRNEIFVRWKRHNVLKTLIKFVRYGFMKQIKMEWRQLNHNSPCDVAFIKIVMPWEVDTPVNSFKVCLLKEEPSLTHWYKNIHLYSQFMMY